MKNNNNFYGHKIKRAEAVQSVKDIVTVLASHSWELTQVEKYGEFPSGFLATMDCGGCGAECSLLVIPSQTRNANGRKRDTN